MFKTTLATAMILLGVSALSGDRIHTLAQEDLSQSDICHTTDPHKIIRMKEDLSDRCVNDNERACDFYDVIEGCEDGN